MGLSLRFNRCPSPRWASDSDCGLFSVHGDVLVLNDDLLLAAVAISPQGLDLRRVGPE
jgi:hypothetical protein